MADQVLNVDEFAVLLFAGLKMQGYGSGPSTFNIHEPRYYFACQAATEKFNDTSDEYWVPDSDLDVWQRIWLRGGFSPELFEIDAEGQVSLTFDTGRADEILSWQSFERRAACFAGQAFAMRYYAPTDRFLRRYYPLSYT